jgi:glucose/arabinose dehydrogenase/cytochrome c5
MNSSKLQRSIFLVQMTTLVLVALGLVGQLYHQRVHDSTPAVKPSASPGSKLKQPKAQQRPGKPEPYHGSLPSLAGINVRDAILEPIVRGLQYPWAMELLTPGELLVTEIRGAIKRVDVRSGDVVTIEGLPGIPTGKPQLGLLDVELDPDFQSNNAIYFSHAVAGEGSESGQYALGVSRGLLQQDRLTNVQRIFTGTPFGSSASNFGGALAFDDEGWLYIATGDRSTRDHASDGRLLNGKILRVSTTGAAAGGNPFLENPEIDDRIYALGVRNPQGLTFDARSRRLIETEHGPMGGDEVNIIRRGADYGWPRITYGANYNTRRIGVGTRLEGLEQPLFYYLPSIAISPVAVYRGEMFPEWEGHLLVGALKGNLISKLDVLHGRVMSEHRILNELGGRIRDIKVAPDGAVLILVQNGVIYRLYREPATVGPDSTGKRTGADVYELVCASCHSARAPGAPQLGDSAAWTQRLAKGRAALLGSTINGLNGMPERGLCEDCSDDELAAAVNHMLIESGVQE